MKRTIDKVIISLSNDSVYNLALEEYLFYEASQSTVLFYVNTPCMVVGKHQNAFAELNPASKLDLYRRISGGGAVFHDLGNLNFSHIENFDQQAQVDYPESLNFMVDYLKSNGVEASWGDRNELLVEGKKVSGTACHLRKNRSIHHGTLLVSSDLEALRESIGKKKHYFKSKAVSSVPSPVINLKELDSSITVEALLEGLGDFFQGYLPEKNIQISKVDPSHLSLDSYAKKYTQLSWNYGYSPSFEYDDGINQYSFEKNQMIESTFF